MAIKIEKTEEPTVMNKWKRMKFVRFIESGSTHLDKPKAPPSHLREAVTQAPLDTAPVTHREVCANFINQI